MGKEHGEGGKEILSDAVQLEGFQIWKQRFVGCTKLQHQEKLRGPEVQFTILLEPPHPLRISSELSLTLLRRESSERLYKRVVE